MTIPQLVLLYEAEPFPISKARAVKIIVGDKLKHEGFWRCSTRGKGNKAKRRCA